jgi:multidrug resistance efflux pump
MGSGTRSRIVNSMTATKNFAKSIRRKLASHPALANGTNASAVGASLKAAQAVMKLSQLELEYTVIRSPISGVVIAKRPYVGRERIAARG